MLDDRNVVADGVRDALLTWDHDMSFTCWTALLGDQRGTESVSPVAAPPGWAGFAVSPRPTLRWVTWTYSATRIWSTRNGSRLPGCLSSSTSTPARRSAGPCS